MSVGEAGEGRGAGALAAAPTTDLHVFVTAGEASGDALGSALMRGLRARAEDGVHFTGVGGTGMTALGLRSLFPLADIAVMGIGPVLRRLPTILERIRQTADAAIASDPDVAVLIDAPDFSHRVARRLRKRRPDLPIVCYVSPTVWAWRPGRARAMARFCDLLLAVLPFEPEAHRLLGGPPTIYVGHPAAGRLAELTPGEAERAPYPRAASAPLRLVVCPGSRHSEVSRLMPLFGDAVAAVAEAGPLEVTIPVVDHVRADVEAGAQAWAIPATLVHGEAAKYAAFRRADLALAASGTVTLELALARVPMVVAYRLDWLAARLRPFIGVPKPLRSLLPVPSIVLANLITAEAAIPEFIHEAATADALAAALRALAETGPTLDRQLAAFDKLIGIVAPPEARDPGLRAADAVLGLVAQRRSAMST